MSPPRKDAYIHCEEGEKRKKEKKKALRRCKRERQRVSKCGMVIRGITCCGLSTAETGTTNRKAFRPARCRGSSRTRHNGRGTARLGIWHRPVISVYPHLGRAPSTGEAKANSTDLIRL